MLMSPADEAWVKELYEANALKLYKVAFRRLGDKDEAENVVQEAFLLLLARFDTVRVHPNPLRVADESRSKPNPPFYGQEPEAI